MPGKIGTRRSINNKTTCRKQCNELNTAIRATSIGVVASLIPADPVRGWVGIHSNVRNAPTVEVIIPKTNRFGVTLAEIKRALREHCLVVNLVSADANELLQFILEKKDVDFHWRLPKPPIGGYKPYSGT
jgi:hypothetical protein